MSDIHPFTLYNKCDEQGALVGNWVEERALRGGTGIFRYQEWVKDDGGKSVYAQQTTSEAMETFPRVLEHSDRLESHEWQTHNQAMFPENRERELRVYSDPKKLGLRNTAALATLREQANALPPSDPVAPTPASTMRDAYTTPPLDTSNLGKSVMKTLDLVPIPAEARDATFRSELGMATKAFVDKAEVPPVDPARFASHYAIDTPITLYSTMKSSNKKNTEFTKPISDCTKKQELL
mmetsp:Transcript_2770/g.10046  ORF Transcript_2770/g.10046 Transcript_2770/m.10046 type:complete len:237 (+) Transcript_2770:4375-5085(+)